MGVTLLQARRVRLRQDRYACEERVAVSTSASTCARLGIVPTVRHADYPELAGGAARQQPRHRPRRLAASNAADYLLAFRDSETAAASGEAGR